MPLLAFIKKSSSAVFLPAIFFIYFSGSQTDIKTNSNQHFYILPGAIDSMINAEAYLAVNEGPYFPDLNVRGSVSKITVCQNSEHEEINSEHVKENISHIITFHNRLITSVSDYDGLKYQF